MRRLDEIEVRGEPTLGEKLLSVQAVLQDVVKDIDTLISNPDEDIDITEELWGLVDQATWGSQELFRMIRDYGAFPVDLTADEFKQLGKILDISWGWWLRRKFNGWLRQEIEAAKLRDNS